MRSLFAAEGQNCIALSLDDFYLIGSDQTGVSDSYYGNRLLQFRGNGNNHIVALVVMIKLFVVLYCIVLYCIVLYCIVLYCIVLCLLYCIILYCIILYCIVLYCLVSYCIVLYCIVLYCIVLCCIVLCCIELYCIVLYCFALYCVYCIVLYCIHHDSFHSFLLKIIFSRNPRSPPSSWHVKRLKTYQF